MTAEDRAGTCIGIQKEDFIWCQLEESRLIVQLGEMADVECVLCVGFIVWGGSQSEAAELVGVIDVAEEKRLSLERN